MKKISKVCVEKKGSLLPYLMVVMAWLVGSAAAQTNHNVTLAWDPNSEPDLGGYFLYYGPSSRTYDQKIDVSTNTTATVSNLQAGATYYFAVTAYNTSALESHYSNEVSYSVPVTNQPPTLSGLANQSIVEDSSSTVTFQVTDAETAAASLSVSVSSSSPTLLPASGLVLGGSGTARTLQISPTADAFGSANISVSVTDGTNTTTQTFLVSVLPSNDAPTLDGIADLTVAANSGLQTISLTGIGTGAANEIQTLSVTSTSSDTSLVPDPVVSYLSPNATATLTIWPQTDAVGSSVITVTVQDDGGTANGGQNVVTRQFRITVDPVVDLGLAQSATPSPAWDGSNMVVSVLVANRGPATATGVQLTDLVPVNATLISAVPDQGTITNLGSTLHWTVGTVSNGSMARLDLTLRPQAAGFLTNIASVVSAELEAAPSDNTLAAEFTVNADSDGDGVPDAYEIAYGLDPNNALDADADQDGDGLSALQEYLAGTDPTDSQSALRVSSIDTSGSDIVIQFTAIPGKIYELQRNASFPAGQWRTVANGLTTNNSSIQVTDANAASLWSAAYRVVVTP